MAGISSLGVGSGVLTSDLVDQLVAVERKPTDVRLTRETQQVIRQIPDELALQLAEKLQQDEPLTLFNIKV